MHFKWNVEESRKNLVNRFVRAYIDEFVDRNLLSRNEMWSLIRNVVIIFNPSDNGTQDNSIMLGNVVEMKWVQGEANLQSNCIVLSQELAHYILWKLGLPHSIWHDKVHEYWNSKTKIVKFTLEYWSWKYLKYMDIILYGLDIYDLYKPST